MVQVILRPARRPRRSTAKSDKPPPELALLLTYFAQRFGQPVTEHRFARPEREFRFDWAWIDKKIAFEREGGTWSTKKKSRHTTGQGYEDDCIKYSMAAIRGWLVVRATTTMIQDGRALGLLEQAFAARRYGG